MSKFLNKISISTISVLVLFFFTSNCHAYHPIHKQDVELLANGFFVGLMGGGVNINNHVSEYSDKKKEYKNSFFIPSLSGYIGYRFGNERIFVSPELEFSYNKNNSATAKIPSNFIQTLRLAILNNVEKPVSPSEILNEHSVNIIPNVIANARLVVGTPLSESVLVFVSGGAHFAFGDTYDVQLEGTGNTHGNISGLLEQQSFSITTPKINYGWTLGAGVDYALTDNIMIRLEGRYTNLKYKATINEWNPIPLLSQLLLEDLHKYNEENKSRSIWDRLTGMFKDHSRRPNLPQEEKKQFSTPIEYDNSSFSVSLGIAYKF